MPCRFPFPRPLWSVLLAVVLGGSVAVAAVGRRAFDVPAGEAAETLRLAAHQGGVEIVLFAETVRGVRTAALRGEFFPREALERLLAGTGLEIAEAGDPGTLTVRRRLPPAGSASPAPDAPSP
ncbi:MAG: STN domain-containing protein, partial [Verrucomicrobiota bacterium]